MTERTWTDVDETELGRARARMARWESRRQHRERGGKTLTLSELESLIMWTQTAAMVTESPLVLATTLARLDDMHREHRWRAFLGEETTDWPDSDSEPS